VTVAAPALRIEEFPDRVLLTLDRPAVRNAIDQQLVDELHHAAPGSRRSRGSRW
jgi:enoyl-CoA hydratase/carnithine racemase